jgi:tRNA (Thr-GGU) A37 N-methylase/ribosomal protein S18 acetylase RimI-like enzyme
MNTQLNIREASLLDAKILCDAEKEVARQFGHLVSLPEELKLENFEKRISEVNENGLGRYLVAETNGLIVGHAQLDPMGLKAISHVVRLTMCVHKGCENKRIGSHLLANLIQWAKTDPRYEKIELNVRRSNKFAIRLYQKFGFQIEGCIAKRVKRVAAKDVASQIRTDDLAKSEIEKSSEAQICYLDDLEMGLFVKASDLSGSDLNEGALSEAFTVFAIGRVSCTRTAIQDDFWDQEQSFIELDSTQFNQDCLDGLDGFSHIEVLYRMDQVNPLKIESTSRHPRNNLAWPKVGIFAQRAKNRPNQMGLSVCQILKIQWPRIYVKGLDAIDGTSVIDIKPVVKEFLPAQDTIQPAWMTELMKNYWK